MVDIDTVRSWRSGDEADMLRELADRYPSITELVTAITHDEASVVGQGCDDQFEFEFAWT